ncbi:MAG: hypothetical protein IJG16_12795 [Clostridia bacterium]|nr:hypothetical protein [Clostridia bacterium]
MSSDFSNNSSENNENLKMKNIKEFGLFSYEMESKREESLIEQSGKMMTAFSIYTAAPYMLVDIAIKHFVYLKYEILLATGVISLCLLTSLVLTIISQWRFKYKKMSDIGVFFNYINQEQDRYVSQADYDYQWKIQIESIQKSKEKNNDHRAKLIMAAMIVFLIAIGMTLLSAYILLFIKP